MAVQRLIIFGGSGAGTTNADTAANGNTVALRDNQGNLTAAQMAATELLTSGILTLAPKAPQTASITLDNSAVFWPFDATSAALVPNLPPASTCPGRVYIIQKIDSAAHNVTITCNGGTELINAATTKAITAQWGTVIVICNAAGTGWNIIGLI